MTANINKYAQTAIFLASTMALMLFPYNLLTQLEGFKSYKIALKTTSTSFQASTTEVNLSKLVLSILMTTKKIGATFQ